MATLITDTEKVPAAPPQLFLKTPNVYEKASSDTLTSAHQGANEKNGSVSIDASRRSDVSTPRSNHQNPFDTDVEAMITPSMSREPASRKLTNMTTQCNGGADCQVWPGRQHWVQKAKAAKKKRGCNCMAQLSRRNRIIINCLIVLILIGIALGVGIGISKALGAKY